MNTMRLRSHDIRLDLHPRFPAVVGYRLAGRGIPGDPEPVPPACRVWSPEARANLQAAEAGLDMACQVRREGPGVAYALSLGRAGKEAIRLLVRMGLEDSELVVRLDGVEERDGWQLVHVDLWRLASAHTHEPDSRLVIPTRGGRRIDPARSAPGERVHAYNWMQESFSQVGVVYDGPACGVLILESLNDLMLSSVSDCAGGRAASLGVRMVHRMEAADAGLQFQVHSPSRFRIRLLDSGLDDAAAGWVPAAALVRERLGSPPRDPYRDRFVYKVFVGRPGSPAEVPFEQVIQGIRSRFHRTDGAAQVCYLVGFQHQGHDSGYPDVFTANQAAGGLEKLASIMEEARAYNTVVSFHDNYDDAYLSSAAWDPADIGTDRTGGLLKGGVWNGEQAYWISLPKYVREKAALRMDRTLAMYPIHDTYHLDVLTASVFRTDYDPLASQDRNDDLAARGRLVAMFRQRGIDVTSEGCGLPFLRDIRYFWDMPRLTGVVYAGEDIVPFCPFVAHGVAGYGGSRADRHGILEGLLAGAFYCTDIGPGTPEQELLDAFYLLQLPLNALRDQPMVGYEERSAWRKVLYGNGSFVEVDFRSLEHRVVVGGQAIVENYVCLAPGRGPDTYLLYVSPMAETWMYLRRNRWPCPPRWRERGFLEATELTTSGEGRRRRLSVEDGQLVLDIPAGVPHRLTAPGSPDA